MSTIQVTRTGGEANTLHNLEDTINILRANVFCFQL